MLSKYKNEAAIIGMSEDEIDTEKYLDFGFYLFGSLHLYHQDY